MPDIEKTPVDPLVRVYNKSGRSITTGKFRASPQSFATVTQSVADAWMRQWPGEIVEAAVAQQEVNGAAAEAAALREKLATAEKKSAELEAKLGKPANKRALELEAQLAEALKKNAELEEKLTSPGTSSDVV